MLEIVKKDARSASSGGIVADRALALTADKETVVDANHAKADSVLVGEGGTIPGAEVKRLGLSIVSGKVTQSKAKPAKTDDSPAAPAAPPVPPTPEKQTPARPEKKERPKAATKRRSSK